MTFIRYKYHISYAHVIKQNFRNLYEMKFALFSPEISSWPPLSCW